MQKVYDVISWDNVGPRITAFSNAFTTTFNSIVDNLNWDLLGSTIGAGINTIVNTANLLITGIQWKNLGMGLATGLNEMVFEVNWENLGNMLGNYFMISWDIFYGFVTNLDYYAIGRAVSNGLNGIINSIDLATIAKGLSDFAVGMLTSLNIAIDNLDWEQLGKKIVDAIAAVDWAGLATGLFDAGLSLIGGILDAFGELPLPVQIAGSAIAGFLAVFKGLSFIKSVIKMINGAGGLLSVLKSLSSMFGGPVGLAIAGIITLGTILISNWDDIKEAAKKVADFMSNQFSRARESIDKTFENIGDWFSDRWDDIKNIFSNVKEFFGDAFQSAYDAATKAWIGIGGFFKGIANSAIKPIGKLVNGIIDGINWVSNKLGVGDVLKNWDVPKFAKGSDGINRDTFGVVNDQKGPVYKELIVPPSGKPFIPNGRNVMLPLQKGTKIMPAGQTKELMKMSKIPHFAGGIGDFFSGAWEKVKDIAGNIWDYMTHPDKILQIAINKFVDMTGLFEPWLSIAGGIVNKIFDRTCLTLRASLNN